MFRTDLLHFIRSLNTVFTLTDISHTIVDCGPGSSDDIATGYGPDGPGSNPGRDEIFHPSRPALETTYPPVKWVQSLSRG